MGETGRPSEYTEDIANSIFEELSTGRSLRQICSSSDMPCIKTIYNWIDNRDGFLQQYTRAREQQAEYFAQDIVNIADTEEDPQRAKIRIDARKWVASKLKGSLYGDKQSIDHTSKGEKLQSTQTISTADLEAFVAKQVKSST